MNKGRISTLKSRLSQLKVENFFISNSTNIYYLTGFQALETKSRDALLLVTKNETILFTNPLNDANIADKSLSVRLLTREKDLGKHLSEIIKDKKIKSLGFEEENLKFSEYDYLSRKLKLKLKPLKQVVIEQREIKDENEIKKIQKACRIADDCLGQIIKLLKVGITEKEVVAKIEFYFKDQGFDISFEPIVAFDRNSAIPHYNTKKGEGKLKKDSVILIDFGAQFENYCSDMTRMFFGQGVSMEVIDVYKKLLDAQQKTIERIKKFKKTREADDFVRSELKNHRLPTFPHSVGHGIGLDVHELPKVGPTSKEKITNNQVFTIEPGVYFPEKWGMRIEDVVRIKKGQAELLTGFSKEPKILTL